MSTATDLADTTLNRTPLHARHIALGARMVPFAGYAMPVQFEAGVLREHLHTRSAAGLFDVSHMGQIAVRATSGDPADTARALERLVPGDILGLPPGRQRYGLLTAGDGGILDDVIIANRGGDLLLVVNAACKAADEAHLRAGLAADCTVEPLDRALLALQGPRAAAVLARLAPECAAMRFMEARTMTILGAECFVARAGYTGEDGFEVSLPPEAAEAFAEALLEHADVAPVGLGARDSLRLEAGLCLYGADIDTGTTPIEADLAFAIPRVRRAEGARAGGFPGAAAILAQLRDGPPRRRVGLRVLGRAPVRAGALLFADAEGGDPVGRVTSGSFAPSVDSPVAMAYVPGILAGAGTPLYAEVRGRRLAAEVTAMPFIVPRYHRG